MNIFFLDQDPKIAAQNHCDKHVVKMILEYAQLMSTTHHVCGTSLRHFVYRPTHVNHPAAIWTRSCRESYQWLHSLATHLCDEFEFRYDNRHKTRETIEILREIPDLSCGTLHLPVEDSRRYYRETKKTLATWCKGRETPLWW